MLIKYIQVCLKGTYPQQINIKTKTAMKVSGLTQEMKIFKSTSKNKIRMKTGMVKTTPANTPTVLHY